MKPTTIEDWLADLIAYALRHGEFDLQDPVHQARFNEARNGVVGAVAEMLEAAIATTWYDGDRHPFAGTADYLRSLTAKEPR